jgi:RimJ/RimL family protein N-acetyltransferase
MRDRPADSAACLIFLRTDAAPCLVGGIGFGRTPEKEVELGYWIARPFWGQGIATEAGRALLDTARESLRLPRLVAGHFTDNPASGRVLEKLGFRPTGVTRGRYSAGRNGIAPARELALELCASAACDARAIAA